MITAALSCLPSKRSLASKAVWKVVNQPADTSLKLLAMRRNNSRGFRTNRGIGLLLPERLAFGFTGWLPCLFG